MFIGGISKGYQHHGLRPGKQNPVSSRTSSGEGRTASEGYMYVSACDFRQLQGHGSESFLSSVDDSCYVTKKVFEVEALPVECDKFGNRQGKQKKLLTVTVDAQDTNSEASIGDSKVRVSAGRRSIVVDTAKEGWQDKVSRFLGRPIEKALKKRRYNG